MSFVGKTGQGISGFSPTSIPGCALWLDAADSSSLTLSGSNATGWRDKSGTGRTVTFSNTITYTSATPSVNTSIANGSRIVVDLDLRKSVVNNANIFIVYAWSGFSVAGTYNQFLWGQDMGGGWNRLQFLSYPAATSFAYNLGYRLTGGPPYSVPVSNMATSNRLLYHATYSYLTANATGVYINGTLSSTLVTEGAASPETTSTSTVFGTLNLDAGAPFANIEFNEILAFSNAITTDQRQQIEGYLARKWGLTAGLPATQPFKSLPPFTRPFLPIDISGCALWLDAADGTSVTLSNSNVTQWSDKSGNGRNATGGVSPTFSNSGVVFNGTNQYLATTYTAVPAAESFFAVASYRGTTDNKNNCMIGTSATNGRNYNVNRTSGVNTIRWDRWGVGAYSPTSGPQNNTLFLTSGIFTGTAGTTGINGGSQSASSNFSFSGTGTTNIGTGVLADYYEGTVNEIVCYSVAVTPSQRQQIETYLANKWGLRGLTPSNHYARLAPALSVSFVPTSVDSCALWLDGADRSVFTLSGSNVTQWNDKSGNGYNFTVPGGGYTSPRYDSNAINGANSVFFQGSGVENGKYNALTNASVPVTGSAYSMFAVVRRNATAPSWTGANYIMTDAANGRLFYATYSGGFFATSTGTSAGGFNDLNVNVPNTTLTTTTVTGMVVNGSVLTPYVNGSAMNTKTGTTTSYSGLYIADATTSGQTWTGYICEILIYNTALTPQQRQIIEGYLANKWGLANSLPNGHPFKTAKP